MRICWHPLFTGYLLKLIYYVLAPSQSYKNPSFSHFTYILLQSFGKKSRLQLTFCRFHFMGLVKKPRECLVCIFKQLFSFFKQHFIFFHTLFYSHVFSQMFLNNNFQFLNTCTKATPSLFSFFFFLFIVCPSVLLYFLL